MVDRLTNEIKTISIGFRRGFEFKFESMPKCLNKIIKMEEINDGTRLLEFNDRFDEGLFATPFFHHRLFYYFPSHT